MPNPQIEISERAVEAALNAYDEAAAVPPQAVLTHDDRRRLLMRAALMAASSVTDAAHVPMGEFLKGPGAAVHKALAGDEQTGE